MLVQPLPTPCPLGGSSIKKSERDFLKMEHPGLHFQPIRNNKLEKGKGLDTIAKNNFQERTTSPFALIGGMPEIHR